MHTVVNHLPIAPGTNWTELAEKVDSFAARIRDTAPEVLKLQLIRVSDTEAIFVITFADEATCRSFSSAVAAPWFAEHIRPYLDDSVARSMGEMIAGFL